MSLTTKAIKNQLKLKLNVHADMLVYLIVLQIIGMVLFSFSGSGQMGKGSENFSLKFTIYSPDGIFMLSVLWIFYVAVTLTRKGTRREILPYMRTPKIDSITDIIILIYMNAFLTFTIMLSNYLLYAILIVFTKKEFVEGITIFNEPKVFFINTVAVFIVSMVIASIGYLIGTLIQISRLLILVFIAFFIGYNSSKLSLFIVNYFYQQNPNFLPFAIFNIVIITFCLFVANVIRSRMEVKGA
ncbi:hypothetical protein ACQKM9_08050 [Viridibacillus sp. NPDC093762]|uniref:hypothetical protein n=1 Tax=Viridibacillus sp. NPDC093762 TaxID=3390720 RepID=UPI003CFD2F5A